MPEIIHEDQTGFLPMEYILDNVLLQHEAIDWAWESGQEMLLLKLDFRKAYDTVSLPFLFQAMRKLGIAEEYIKMTQTLFKDFEVAIYLNSKESDSFPIHRRVRQGCPLAPFLFLFVGEALHLASVDCLRRGALRGIELPGGTGQQLMVQYADDTNYTLLATRENMISITELLQTFWLATGLKTNWEKNTASFFGPGPPPLWLQDYNCQWAVAGNLGKLLGLPFGIDIATADVD
jgi:hypothetical protein